MIPVTTASDAELWAQTCRGEFPAFEEIVKRYQNLLCSLAYSRCGDFAVSEDLAQEAFWVAWNSRDSPALRTGKRPAARSTLRLYGNPVAGSRPVTYPSASEVVFFQGELAHASYTAAAPLIWPDSPAAEALENLTKSGQLR